MNYGDIIQLGRHRLMCGDATRVEDVHALVGSDKVNLVLTDPPYGVRSVNPKTGQIGFHSKVYFPTIGDADTDMFTESYRILRGLTTRLIIWGGQNFSRILPPSCGWLFWDKCKSPGLSFGDGELAWSNIGTQIKKYVFKWDGFHREGSKTLNEKVHPNQKPVELHARILEDFTRPDDVILDCFGGSGTTLIACEITGRTCLMMEISPGYCDVIANRYKTLTEGMIDFACCSKKR